ncbi:MAG TPA: glycoside hydrolase family 25 protein [Verrucomicrobiae bacterium]|jgi:GH25 family lysozyme M1 (1,4-beta-N-acetylmuramidase)|nr:glycoside hydrolase family 25 protein [Verrucomicrobiae bacterium]
MKKTLEITAVLAVTLAVGVGQSQARLSGVDVYSGTGTINWSSVHSAGISFAFTKATQGNYYHDANMAANMNNGKAAGVVMGVYDFADPASCSPGTEANYFWNYAQSYIKADGQTLMPVLDFEPETLGESTYVGASSWSDWVNQWCNDVKNLAAAKGLDIVPIIYISAGWTGTYLSSANGWTGAWIADYNGESSQTGSPWGGGSYYQPWGSGVWDFWQYTSSGSVSGISGACDRDVLNGTSLTSYLVESAIPAVCDFNVSGQTDYSVFRPSNSGWYISPSVNPIQFGASTDIAVPADYNGTGTAQPAVWRPSTGDWYVYPSVNPTHWGTTGDIPVPGDYTGAGKAQLATWRPSNGTWFVDGIASVQWGTNGDIPVPGYYLGDGHMDYAVYRPSNNKWFIHGGSSVQFGTNGDIPVPGDYAGNGTTQIAMFRPSNGSWYVYGVGITNFGINGDVPVPGTYTGNGVTQPAVWRPSNNNWYVNGVGITTYGTTGDVPLPLPYAIRHYSLGYNN